MDTQRLLNLPSGLLLLMLAGPTIAQLPYNPTRIFQSRHDDDILYVFRPAPSATNHSQLLSLDVSSDLSAASLPFTTLYPSLPFTSSDSAVPYIPVAESNGNLTVYAGNCGTELEDAQIWKFEVDTDSDDGNGTWIEVDVSLDGDGDGETLLGPNYLSSGISFSSIVGADDPDLFAFGGMCPTDDATQDTWVSAANYSNAVLRVGSNDTAQYLLDIVPNRSPPVAEAGFGVVALSPSYSNNSDGTADQEQNFVLIGGHTASAFINMSQVALYSLPEETWTFLPVDQPSGDSATEVEPRSGHTAVRTSDGTKIIVLGGWVGDIDTPADPQLAVLSIGEGYGGSGSWSWSTPSASGSGLADGAGIYGHGAIMLSGDVMMVAGGYSIASSSSKFRRRATATQNTQNYFFNVSSNSWLSEYSPAAASASSGSSSSSGTLSSTSQKVGLSVGLGIGLAAVLGMTLFYFWYKRHLRRKRDLREKELRDLALGAHYSHGIGYGNGGLDSRGRDPYADDYLSDREAAALAADPWYSNGRQGWKGQRAHDAERTGLLVEIPSPTRGLRRNLQGRAYHQAPRYDDSRANQGSGNIHRIDEREEEEEDEMMPEMSERPQTAEDEHRISLLSTTSSKPLLDPFTEPDPLRSHPLIPPQLTAHFPTSLGGSGKRFTINPGPSSAAQARAAETRQWSPNWEFGGSLLPTAANSNSMSSRSGRSSSPEKSDRTESNLSDRSSRSGLSARSTAASLARTLSMRSAALLASISNPFSTPQASPTHERESLAVATAGGAQSLSGPMSAIQPRKSGETLHPPGSSHSNPHADADSFTTARTTFAQLQAEGEALLGGRPDHVDDIPTSVPFPSLSPIDPSSPHYHRTLHQPPPEDESQAPPALDQDHQLQHMASSDTLDLHSPVDNSFATRDRSKSIIGGVRIALGRRPTLSSSHDNDGRTNSLTRGLHRRSRRYSYSNSLDSPQHSPGERGSISSAAWGYSGDTSPAKSLGAWQERTGSAGRASGAARDTDGSPPRRAASDAGFWARSKRGSKAWSEDLLGPGPGGDDDEDWIGPSNAGMGMGLGTDGEAQGRDDEPDWDVEAAAEKRDVQLCFTVPRQRLRVVNADAEADRETPSTDDGSEVDKEKGKERERVPSSVKYPSTPTDVPAHSPLLSRPVTDPPTRRHHDDAPATPSTPLTTTAPRNNRTVSGNNKNKQDDPPTTPLAPETPLSTTGPVLGFFDTSPAPAIATPTKSSDRPKPTKLVKEKKETLLSPWDKVGSWKGKDKDKERERERERMRDRERGIRDPPSPAGSVKDMVLAIERRGRS